MKTQHILLVFMAIVMFCRCQDADNFFNDQEANPEIDFSQEYGYLPSYVVGDTMTITGRLNPSNGLVIRIGDADARIVKTSKIFYGTGTAVGSGSLDQVKFLITESMGIGASRTVTISSGGYTAQGSPIEILGVSDAKGVADSLQLVAYFTLPENALLFHCRSGDGAVYFYDNQQQAVKKVTPVGAVNTIFSLTTLSDEFGAFTIRQFYSGGVDPQQKVFYFSAKTNEPALADKKIFRLCKVDLQSGLMSTLNRTELTKDSTQLTVDDYKPFEGKIGDIKMLGAANIFPDSKGGLYMTLRIDYSGFINNNFVQPYALVSLNANGNLKYILKEGDGELIGYAITPMIWNDEYQLALGLESFMSVLPGNGAISLFEFGAAGLSGPLGNSVKWTVAPDDKIAYFTRFGRKVGFFQYDLESRGVVNQINKYFGYNSDNPVFTGSFSSPNFYLPNSYQSGGSDQVKPDYFFIPLPNEKVLFLGPTSDETDRNFRFYIEDFFTKRAYQYAPGEVLGLEADEDGTYLDLSFSKMPNELLVHERLFDDGLNYDKEGMAYAVMGKYSTFQEDESGSPVRLASVLVKTQPIQ